MPESKKTNFKLQQFLVLQRRLARHVWKQFEEDRSFEEAASLSYTSLLALVPLLAVIFGIVAAFPVFSEWTDKLKSFIFNNLQPRSSPETLWYSCG